MRLRILVTGASGNVGAEVLRHLTESGIPAVAGLRNARASADCEPVDFERGIGPAGGYDAVFLVRPPRLTDPALFAAFLDRFARDTLVVFLSVQGADTKSYLPHAKIEKVIAEMGFPHVFVRPGYFLDNLTTTLWPELERNGRIYLPAGRLKLTWVSARDVACACAAALTGQTRKPALLVTGGRPMGFAEACDRINATLGTSIRYEPASLAGFIAHSRRTGASWSYVMVMLLLHFLPRFGADPQPMAGDLPDVLARAHESIEAFAERHAARFRALP